MFGTKSILFLFTSAAVLCAQDASLQQQQQALEESIKAQQQALERLKGMQQQQATPPAASTSAPATTAPAMLAPKQPGIIRIGVVQPKARLDQTNSAGTLSEPTRALIVQYLSGPMFDLVPIAAMVPLQIDAEAKQKNCDYVLYSSISQKLNSGSAGFLRKSMPMASMIPTVGAMGGTTAAIASTAAGAAMHGAGGIASTIKAKSEVTFEYKLMVPGNSAPVLANASTAKARQDGEDVITPLIEQADAAITAEVTKRK